VRGGEADVPRAEAARELLAPRDDVWRFVAEPHHLADWWPGVGGVRPDRRGLAAGARWEVSATARPGLLRRAHGHGLLLVRAVDPPARLAFHLTAERIDVDLRLEPLAADRTRARLAVSSPLLVALRRTLPRRALARLYDLVQTAAPG
jgi:uncharacterized protein YndB with AHSA1/START domain